MRHGFTFGAEKQLMMLERFAATSPALPQDLESLNVVS
jgi:hypothetical protein